MGHANTLSRLERLEELSALLRMDDGHTASSLARQLGVSTRTLMRDLEVLREKGYPIETDQGRGGGIRLHRHWGIGRLNLSYREVVDLLLSLAVMEKIGSPIFLQNLKSIRHKISASFPQEQRTHVSALRNRIMVGGLASNEVLSNVQTTPEGSADALSEAFFDMKALKIEYSDANAITTERLIEPHFLFLSWPAWYVLAWDYLRDDIRCFRLDRIATAEITNQQFKLRNRKAFICGMESFVATL